MQERSRLLDAASRTAAACVVVLFGLLSPLSARAQADGDGANAGDDPDSVPTSAEGDAYADTDPSALADFRQTLDPHGAWYDDPTYGTVWVPSVDEVGADFAPYVSEGSWAYDDDYVWMSAYEWGWVPFHYGRWAWVSGRWGWIPGRKYAGAWVTWRTGPAGYGYVGWGPMAPSFGWRSGVASGLGAEVMSRPAPVAFVSRESIFAPRVGAYVVTGDRVRAIASETRPFIRAEPVPSGQPLAQGVMHGPTPASLGIPSSSVVRRNASDRGARQALAYARPSTAQPLGAHPPATHVVRARAGAGAVHGAPAYGGAPPRGAVQRAGMGRSGRR